MATISSNDELLKCFDLKKMTTAEIAANPVKFKAFHVCNFYFVFVFLCLLFLFGHTALIYNVSVVVDNSI